MRYPRLIHVAGLLALVAVGQSASAHHSFQAEYDRDNPVTITGTVTQLEWTNPHARLLVDEVGENGDVVHWDLELGPPTALMRLGWRRDSLQPGTVVTVSGFLSRTEAHVANARTVKLADGREAFVGTALEFESAAPDEEQ